MRLLSHRILVIPAVIFIFMLGLGVERASAGICGGTPCVDSADIINGSITGGDVNPTIQMPGTNITNGSVQSIDIQDGSLTGTDIQDGTIGIALTFSSPKIIHNSVTGNGGTTYTDISVDSTSIPNISFNIYDDITGTTGVGLYNVNSSGSAAPTP